MKAVFFLIWVLLFPACSALVPGSSGLVAPTDPENPWRLVVTLLDDTPTEPYTAKKMTRLVDHMVSNFERHFEARHTTSEVNQATIDVVYYTEIYITTDEDYLKDECGYDGPTRLSLHGCTHTDTGDIWMRHRGRLCDSALVHEFYHKYLHSLYNNWDYGHKDIGWDLVVKPTDQSACDFDELS